MKKITLKISDMHCTSCAISIDFALEDLPGVKSSHTDYVKSMTQVELDSQKVSENKIISTISSLGYSASLVK